MACTVLLGLAAVPLPAQQQAAGAGAGASQAQVAAAQLPPALRDGIGQFRAANYSEALLAFRQVTLDPRLDELHADAYFWLARTYIALQQYDNAGRNLDFLLANFPPAHFTAEARFQRGRLHLLQGQAERSIQELADFLRQYPSSPFVPNAYFWIGEALFTLGQLDTARSMFAKVTEDYPVSAKVEAARYRASVIDFKQREDELLKLLQWSHEEALRSAEEFQRREKDFEQAIAAFQRRIADLERGETATLLAGRDDQIATLREQLAQSQNEVRSLEARLADTTAVTAADGTGTAVAPGTDLQRLQMLLQLKQEALRIQARLLQMRVEREGGS